MHTTTEDVDRFLEELGNVRAYFRVDDDTTAELKNVLDEFSRNFASSDHGGSKAGSEDTATASSDEVEQEQIVRQKR